MTKTIFEYIKLNKETEIKAGIYLAVAFFFFWMFGFSAVSLFIAATVCTLPFYLFLGRFQLEILEKVVFSFFLAMGIIPTLVYPLSFAVGSIRISATLVLIALFSISILANKPVKKQSRE